MVDSSTNMMNLLMFRIAEPVCVDPEKYQWEVARGPLVDRLR